MFECKFNIALKLSIHIQITAIGHTLGNNNFNSPNYNQYPYCMYLAGCCVLYVHELHFLMVSTILFYTFLLVFGFFPDDDKNT